MTVHLFQRGADPELGHGIRPQADMGAVLPAVDVDDPHLVAADIAEADDDVLTSHLRAGDAELVLSGDVPLQVWQG